MINSEDLYRSIMNVEIGKLKLECVNMERDIGLREAEKEEMQTEIERLKAELEMHAWEITPGMAMARLDALNAENLALKAEIEKLRAELKAERQRAPDENSSGEYPGDF